jgi:heme/copper-type cytochrome/quinol oxidase subunit 4
LENNENTKDRDNLIPTTPLSDELKTITNMLPLLIPLAVIQLALMVIALIDLFKRENMKSNTRLIWVFVIVLINTIGPIVYLIAGRKDKPIDGD